MKTIFKDLIFKILRGKFKDTMGIIKIIKTYSF